jgi:hypothetical protein
MRNFAQISQAAFQRIEQVMCAQLEMGFTGVPFKKFDMEKYLTSTLQTLNMIIAMLLPAYAKKMWKAVFEHFVKCFILKVLEGCGEYKANKEEVKIFLDKVVKERQFAKDVFETNIPPKDIQEGVIAIKLYERALTEPKEDLVQILLAIAQKLKDKYNDNYLKWFQKYRSEFGSKEKQELIKLIEHDKAMSKRKKDPALEFYKQTMKEMYKVRFVRKLKEKMKETKKLKSQPRQLVDNTEQEMRKLEQQIVPILIDLGSGGDGIRVEGMAVHAP